MGRGQSESTAVASKRSKLTKDQQISGLTKAVELLADESPMNQDEMGGCVWCGSTPPNQSYGYAEADPSHHTQNCAWLLAQLLLGRQIDKREVPFEDALRLVELAEVTDGVHQVTGQKGTSYRRFDADKDQFVDVTREVKAAHTEADKLLEGV